MSKRRIWQIIRNVTLILAALAAGFSLSLRSLVLRKDRHDGALSLPRPERWENTQIVRHGFQMGRVPLE